ncbi:MAG: hypothetical protein HYX22_02370 [Candidatus Yanofskybacteria bacterium]|nr:hypothetical protein [Candidatus Yanofskybacteria bacterium]
MPPPPIKWTLEKIKYGLDQFYKTNNRYPSALEVDEYPLLPSSRQIQRKYGGLTELRKSLGFSDEDLDYTKGKIRSDVAKIIGERGKSFEKEIYPLLVNKFGEVFVHQQKPFNNYKSRADFFIYAKDYKFGIDVFYPKDLHSFICCVNIKEKTYMNPDFEMIFLSTNPDINQSLINKFIYRRKKKTSHKVMGFDEFKKHINTITPLRLLS